MPLNRFEFVKDDHNFATSQYRLCLVHIIFKIFTSVYIHPVAVVFGISLYS